MKYFLHIYILLFLFGCKAVKESSSSGSQATSSTKGWKLVSDNKYLVRNNVTEMPSLKLNAILKLQNGSLLIIDSNRVFTSFDEGKSWTSHTVFADTNTFNIAPGRLIQTKSGAIVFSFSNWKEKQSDELKAIYGPAKAILPTYAMRSLDGGETWTNIQKLHDDWTGANMDMILTKKGNVVFTSMKLRSNPMHHVIITYTSKDEGVTWTESNTLDFGGVGHHAGVMEPTIIQLNNGKIWMLMRTNWEYFWEAFSDDEGLTWKDVKVTKIDASSSPGELKRLQSGRIVLVWNRLYPEDKKIKYLIRPGNGEFSERSTNWHRNELSIMFSDDDAKTWSKPKVFAKTTKDEQQLCYPFVSEVSPGKLCIVTRFGAELKIMLNEKDYL
ncbi:MAG: sialidase family protein [Ginsengibacter sp.]